MHRKNNDNIIHRFTTILSEWAEGSPAQQLSAPHQHPLPPPPLPPPPLHAPVEIPIPSGTLRRRRNNRFSGYDYSRRSISNDGSSRLSHEEEQNNNLSRQLEHGMQPSPSCAGALSWHREIGGITPSLPFAGRSNEQMTPQIQQSPSTTSSSSGVASDHHQQGNGSGVPSSEQFAPSLSSKRTKRKRRRSTI